MLYSEYLMSGSAGYFPSFEAVLLKAMQGDGDSFAQFYDELYPRVHTFVRLRTGSDPDSVVSDVFLHVFTNLAKFSGNEDQFNGWVFRITRNTLIDDHRKRQRRVSEVSDVDAERWASDDVETHVLGKIQLEALMESLDTLTADQRDVLMLRVVADLTVEATAEVLGKRPGAIKALQRRAISKLSKTISSKNVTL